MSDASVQALPATAPGTATSLKWLMFRLLERASELRHRRAVPGQGAKDDRGSVPDAPPLWVYVSTIGELNAIEPFLRRLLVEMGRPPLVLLTDHPHYRDSFVGKYPDAAVRAVDHRSDSAAALIDERAPRLMVLAEIPCLLSDAPCRFPFALAYELKRRGVPLCLVNGWLYGERPSCTMDAVEKRLFGRDYVRLFDVMTVQDDATRERLLAAGADTRRVHVTGNIKFDAAADGAWTPERTRSPVLLGSIVAGGRPTVVAGCVTDIAEQALALDAFTRVRRESPDALLVLAPRHPEVKERMDKLRSLLAERGLNHMFKSEVGDVAVPTGIDSVVLDTMGELRDFYAASTVSYVGLNHNLLEPLAFGKPVIVTPGWRSDFPSFPVYRLLLERGAVTEVEASALGEAWLGLLSDTAAYTRRREQIEGMLASLKGATGRNLELFGRSGLLQGSQ